MALIKVASRDELAPGTAKQVTVNGQKVALFNVGGKYYAIDDTCTHRGAPLSEGECEGEVVNCPWHGARFDLQTGAVLSPPATRAASSYRVEIVDNEVQLEVP